MVRVRLGLGWVFSLGFGENLGASRRYGHGVADMASVGGEWPLWLVWLVRLRGGSLPAANFNGKAPHRLQPITTHHRYHRLRYRHWHPPLIDFIGPSTPTTNTTHTRCRYGCSAAREKHEPLFQEKGSGCSPAGSIWSHGENGVKKWQARHQADA